MRRLWPTVAALAVGCSVPAAETRERVADEPTLVVEAAEASAPAPDPVLASARASLRSGHVSELTRARLRASSDPDHRRAARLLQSIAGEQPDPIMPAPVVIPRPSEAPTPEPEPDIAPVVEDVDVRLPSNTEVVHVDTARDDGTPDPLPKLSKLPRDGVVVQWFAGATIVEPEPEPPPVTSLEPVLGPELLLLTERPPLPPVSEARAGPGLVILTRASLHDGTAPDTAVLELAGAGPAEVFVQPLDSHHLRLWVVDAGAVPGFMAERPKHPAIEILDIARRERVVELELELAPGWALREVSRLDNGAAVHFSRFDTLQP